MAGGCRPSLRGPAGLVEDHVLAEGHGFLDRGGEGVSVAGLEALHVDREDLDLGIVLDIGQQVAGGEIDLVADGKGVGGVEPGHAAEGGDDERAGLGDEAELAGALPARLRQLGVGNEHGVVAPRVGDDPERVAAEEERPAAIPLMGLADAVSDPGLEVLAALFLADATGDQDHGVGPVVLDEVVDDQCDLIGADRHHKEVDLVGQLAHARHARHAVDLARGRMDDMDAVAVEAGSEDVAEDDPAHVPAAFGNTHDRRRLRLEQAADLVDRPRLVARRGRPEPAQAVERRHTAPGGRVGVDLHLLEVEGGVGVHRGEVVGEVDEGLEALDEDGVVEQPA